MNRHGLLRRGGWLWIVVPSLLAAAILSGVAVHARGAGSQGASDSDALFTIAGVVLIALPVELIAREMVTVRRARRVTVRPHYTHARHHHGGVVQVVTLCLLSLVLGSIATVVGIDKQMLRHDSADIEVLATVQRSTQSCGRSCTYDSYVSFTAHGRTYTDVDVDDDQTRRAGSTLLIFADPTDPSDNVRAADHGWFDFIGGGIGLVLAAGLGVALLRHRRHSQTWR